MTEKRRSLKPIGGRPGLCTVYVRYIEQALRIARHFDHSSYKLVKFLVPILKHLTTNEFIVNDSFHLLKKLLINNLISLVVVWM